MVQKRNIEALMELLEQNEGKQVVIGTHGRIRRLEAEWRGSKA